MPISIADVAKLANVSISTVSRVVNRRAVVNADTRARVESAIQQLGYQPNPFARGLMLRRSDVVGLVLPDIHGEFYSEIIRGADAEARRRGLNLMVSSARDVDDSSSLLSAIQQRMLLDGVAVMVSEINVDIQRVLAKSSIPVCVLDENLDGDGHDSVAIDQQFGAAALCEHLIRHCGVRRIVFLGGHETNVDTAARLDACRTVMSRDDLDIAGEDVHFLDYEYDTAYRYASQHMSAWCGPNVAVFAANDEMAAGVVAAAIEQGIRVPNELRVVGFDDTRVARMMRPMLTTVRVPMSEMGSQAINLLCARIADPQQPPRHVSLRPELIVRESCGSNLVSH